MCEERLEKSKEPKLIRLISQSKLTMENMLILLFSVIVHLKREMEEGKGKDKLHKFLKDRLSKYGELREILDDSSTSEEQQIQGDMGSDEVWILKQHFTGERSTWTG